ncbi:TPA: hypothetical protein ACGXMV_004163 [Bacillus pacificus]
MIELQFGDKVKVKDVTGHQSHYKNVIGIVVSAEWDDEVMVWFQGDYEAETRDAEELVKI